MKKFLPGRVTVVVAVIFIPLALLILPAKLRWMVSAKEVPVKQQILEARQSRDDKHAQLVAALAAPQAQDFHRALAVLVSLDEPGTLNVWQAALNTADPARRQEVWDEYQKVRIALERREFIPQVGRFNAPAAEIAESARLAGLD